MTEFMFPHLGNEIFRLYNTDGLPASGIYEPEKLLIQEWMAVVEESFGVVEEHIAKYLTGSTTFYVRPGGLDSTARTGLINNDANAFATPTFAYNTIADRYDFNRCNVTIQLADGTYAPAASVNGISVTTPWRGGGILLFQGNNTTPTNCVIAATGSASAIVVDDGAYGDIRFFGLEVRSATSYGLVNGSHANVGFGLMAFGFCDVQIATNQAQGHVTSLNSYSIVDDANFHYDAECGHIKIRHQCTIASARDFLVFGSARTNGVLQFESAAGFTGAGVAGTTGAHYTVQERAVIITEAQALDWLPGDSAGNAVTLGAYIGSSVDFGNP